MSVYNLILHVTRKSLEKQFVILPFKFLFHVNTRQKINSVFKDLVLLFLLLKKLSKLLFYIFKGDAVLILGSYIQGG